MKLYSIFHLNTAFSSIERNQIPTIIKNCYWPLLKISEDTNVKISIEATASSLLDINGIDKKWIKKLKKLILTGKCEFLGSGFKQIISPLIPYEVNNYNLKRGNEIYKKLLNFTPNICFVNEQAFSSSMIDLYYSNGYNSIIIDWNNFLKANPSTNNKIKYQVCSIKDNKKNTIDVIWNNSINFQKFQRYIYDEINLHELTNEIENLKNKKNINYCLYGSDVEIFNFRPKRFFNEKKIEFDEWSKIKNLFSNLSKNKKVEFSLIKDLTRESKRTLLKNITTPKNPILVKKQDKYNITRWALTGHDDLKLNTYCWNLFYKIKNKKNKKNWDELCNFWSSDYRTHLTKKKWKELENKINKRHKLNKKAVTNYKYLPKIINTGEYLLKNKNVEVILNAKKGLTIKSYKNLRISAKKLFGWVPQGYLDLIDNDVDYFSGHFTHESEAIKYSDLNFNNKFILVSKNKLLIKVKNEKINYTKIIELKNNELSLELFIKKIKSGVTRIFYITLNPENFSQKSLFYACKNGSKRIEKFFIKNSKNFNHGNRVSASVSANTCLGATDNKFYLGDKKKCMVISIDRKLSCIFPMVQFIKNKKRYLFRVYFSAGESDDTLKIKNKNTEAKIKIKAIKNNLI
jgi:hypothetical protein